MDQLNLTKNIENSLIPLMFAMLGVSEVGAWNFPASQFAVDEFYPDCKYSIVTLGLLIDEMNSIGT
jgi:hypothetical protein